MRGGWPDAAVAATVYWGGARGGSVLQESPAALSVALRTPLTPDSGLPRQRPSIVPGHRRTVDAYSARVEQLREPGAPTGDHRGCECLPSMAAGRQPATSQGACTARDRRRVARSRRACKSKPRSPSVTKGAAVVQIIWLDYNFRTRCSLVRRVFRTFPPPHSP